uniref:Uncharacterized protein n=1 Tax=Anopheles albimanus TaxID=7167 RepID=A0A182F9Z6_ANOAL
VNISNTWTLPQEGFSVFYRYFRDKISWFEADAVCQFHHANLVTVDNGVQFDATRAFLKELDVTSAVWIGLMRPENSARFAWTCSKALDPGSSGYWAEALPAMEQPLCAVVDPTRDFRWHALRCGGPETAAFLCELPVPSWAVDCTITSIPSLTVQYMSDSGTVQLARDCGESGTKHMSCQGKQDRDSIVQQLQCSETEDLASALATDGNSNSSSSSSRAMAAVTATSDATSSPPSQPILEHDILTVVSSNDDAISSTAGSSSTSGSSIDSIVINSNQIEDTVKNVIKKFNLQGLMQSEQTVRIHSGEPSSPSDDVAGGHESSVAGGLGGGGGGSANTGTGPRKVHQGYAKKYSPLYEKKPRYVKKAVLGAGDGLDTEELDEEEREREQEEAEEAAAEEEAVAEEEEEEEEERMMGDQPVLDETETRPIDIIQKAVKPTADGDYPLVEPAQPASPAPSAAMPPVEAGLTTTTTTTTADSRLRRATDPADDASEDGTTQPTSTPPHTTTTTATATTTTTTTTTVASHILPTTPRKEVITGDHFIPPMLLVKARFISARPHTEPPPTTVTPPPPPQVANNATTMQTPTTSTEAARPSTFIDGLATDGRTDGATPTLAAREIESTTVDSNDVRHVNSTTVPSEQATFTSPAPFTVASEGASFATELSSPGTPEIGSSSTSPTAAVQEEQEEAKQLASGPMVTDGDELDRDGDMDGDGDEKEHESEQHTTELHNSFSNVENYQPYKPNRHRALTKAEQHHNHGNYIKKILVCLMIQ